MRARRPVASPAVLRVGLVTVVLALASLVGASPGAASVATTAGRPADAATTLRAQPARAALRPLRHASAPGVSARAGDHARAGGAHAWLRTDVTVPPTDPGGIAAADNTSPPSGSGDPAAIGRAPPAPPAPV